MARARYSAEQIIHKLRQAEVLLGEGAKIPEVARQLGITVRPHSSLGYHPPAPETTLPEETISPPEGCFATLGSPLAAGRDRLVVT